MPNAPAIHMSAAHPIRVRVSVRDRAIPGLVDTTTPIVPSVNNGFASVVIDPTDPRAVIVTAGLAAGGLTLTIQENPATPDPLHLPITVDVPPDISGVDLVDITNV